jgi:hypothetical protein
MWKYTFFITLIFIFVSQKYFCLLFQAKFFLFIYSISMSFLLKEDFYEKDASRGSNCKCKARNRRQGHSLYTSFVPYTHTNKISCFSRQTGFVPFPYLAGSLEHYCILCRCIKMSSSTSSLPLNFYSVDLARGLGEGEK